MTALFWAAGAPWPVGQVGLLEHLQLVGDEAGLVFENLLEMVCYSFPSGYKNIFWNI